MNGPHTDRALLLKYALYLYICLPLSLLPLSSILKGESDPISWIIFLVLASMNLYWFTILVAQLYARITGRRLTMIDNMVLATPTGRPLTKRELILWFILASIFNIPLLIFGLLMAVSFILELIGKVH